MGYAKIEFRVCETRHCPLFRFGDLFQLSGIAVHMESQGENSFINTSVVHAPPGRGSCKILNGDLARLIIEYERADQIPDCLITCSGCTGSIRLEHHRTARAEEPAETGTSQVAALVPLLSDFPFFRHLEPANLDSVVKQFKLRECRKNEIILRKGDAGGHFYVIVAGQVDVLNDAGIAITSLKEGEVFGEMSLICEESVGATVQTARDTRLLAVESGAFNAIVRKNPALQSYFTRLLARRLCDSNRVRSDDYASGMIGKLEEIPPEALFQTLNVNNKTGILTITQLPRGTARFSMRQGALIKASYGGGKGEDAFYEVLREKQGRFKFTPGLPPEDFDVPEIGYFMKLLMQGLQRMDERAGRPTG